MVDADALKPDELLDHALPPSARNVILAAHSGAAAHRNVGALVR